MKSWTGSQLSFQRDEAEGHDYLCLYCESSLFIVDEPFLGLDPLAISDLIELLAEGKSQWQVYSHVDSRFGFS